jgi:hypothetical protein
VAVVVVVAAVVVVVFVIAGGRGGEIKILKTVEIMHAFYTISSGY